ncbi:hypothetical protein HYS54_01200 [Candidatus Micrarchaeota archaeon]|nr:hypothetical protein [Candidatus Micrarchaeota archaeon]
MRKPDHYVLGPLLSISAARVPHTRKGVQLLERNIQRALKQRALLKAHLAATAQKGLG